MIGVKFSLFTIHVTLSFLYNVCMCIISFQVLYGLEYLHGQNILHLNLQPASVVVSALEGCEVKVTDFSLARPAVSPHGEKVPRLGHADFIGELQIYRRLYKVHLMFIVVRTLVLFVLLALSLNQ